MVEIHCSLRVIAIVTPRIHNAVEYIIRNSKALYSTWICTSRSSYLLYE